MAALDISATFKIISNFAFLDQPINSDDKMMKGKPFLIPGGGLIESLREI